MNAVCRALPHRTSCLTRALALHAWLGRLGVQTTLQIGLARSEGDVEWKGHAWLEYQGQAIESGQGDEKYPLTLSIPEAVRPTGCSSQ